MLYVHMYVYVYVCMYVYVCICMCMCMSAYMYVYACVYTLCMHVCMLFCMFIKCHMFSILSRSDAILHEENKIDACTWVCPRPYSWRFAVFVSVYFMIVGPISKDGSPRSTQDWRDRWRPTSRWCPSTWPHLPTSHDRTHGLPACATVIWAQRFFGKSTQFLRWSELHGKSYACSRCDIPIARPNMCRAQKIDVTTLMKTESYVHETFNL